MPEYCELDPYEHIFSRNLYIFINENLSVNVSKLRPFYLDLNVVNISQNNGWHRINDMPLFQPTMA